jgi:hypothetical protein
MIDTIESLKECKLCKKRSEVNFAFCSNCGGKFLMKDSKQNIKSDDSEPKLSSLLATASLYKRLPLKKDRPITSHDIDTSHSLRNIQPISIKSPKASNKSDRIHTRSNRQSPKSSHQISIINDNTDSSDLKSSFLPDVISAIDQYYAKTDLQLEESMLLIKKDVVRHQNSWGNMDTNYHQKSGGDYLSVNHKQQSNAPNIDIGDITHYLDDVGSVTDLYQKYVDREKV